MGTLTSVGLLPPMSPVSPGSFPVGWRYVAGGPGPLVKQCPALLELHGSSSTSWTRQISLLISFDLPTIPPPTTIQPFRHGRLGTLHRRRDCPRLSPGQTFPVEGIAVVRIRVRALLGASPTGLAESSSLALRTGLSSQVALHLSSRKRSYRFRLQAGNVGLEGTFTLLVKRLHRRTSRTRERSWQPRAQP